MAKVCKECQETVDPVYVDELGECPECGHSTPDTPMLLAGMVITAGVFLCITVIGIPVGIAAFWYAGKLAAGANKEPHEILLAEKPE